MTKCVNCNGTGWAYDWRDRDPVEGYKMADKKLCRNCNGSGDIAVIQPKSPTIEDIPSTGVRKYSDLEEHFLNVMGAIDTPIARRKLGYDKELPDWFEAARKFKRNLEP